MIRHTLRPSSPLRLIAWLALGIAPLFVAAAEEKVASAPLISGRVFGESYVASRNLNDPLLLLSESFWLQADPTFGDATQARAIVTVDRTEQSVSSASGTTLGLREAYITHRRGGLEIRFGRQILPWGKSDGINPTDYLSAKNYTVLNPDDEVKRVAGTALELQWTPGGNSPWTLTGVWQLAFPQSTFLVSSNSLPTGVTYQSASLPTQNLLNTEQAFKIAYQGIGWDASASIFRGYNHLPEYYYVGLSGLTPVVGQRYATLRAAGMDASATWGSFIFRLESAYIWTENDSGANPVIMPSHWDTVLGIERPIGDDFRVQVQGIARYHPRFTSPSSAPGSDAVTTIVNPLIARANALLEGYQDQFRPAVTARVAYTNESRGIETGLTAVGNLVGGDYFLKPSFTYAWSEGFKTTLGTEFHSGPEDRPFGALKSFDSVYFEAKVIF